MQRVTLGGTERPHPGEPNSGVLVGLRAFVCVYQVSQVILLRGLWDSLEENHQDGGRDR